MSDTSRTLSDAPHPEDEARSTRERTLADHDHDPDRQEQGRIGYGRWGRLSPIGLGLLILLALGAIYVIDRNNSDDTDSPSGATTTGELMEPRPAPDFELALIGSDETLTLDELTGKTVVLNFWWSGCAPCREEMPALQASSEVHGDDNVVFVGVAAKRDDLEDAEAFVEEYGVTYPTGLDTEGGDSFSGQIEKAYGVPGYPATFFITPDGLINQIVFGALDTEQLDTYIANASD